MELLIGADPEVFLNDKNGLPVSAYGLIPGTKEKPFIIPYGGVQVDGMACEFNVNPVYNVDDFNWTINEILGALKSMVPSYALTSSCVARFTKDYMDAQPEDAKRLGCDPDFNAYTVQCNPSVDASKYPTMRTAAGHIHLGWTNNQDITDPSHFNDCACVARQLDYFLGVPSLYLDTSPDSVLRRQMYGKAGTFRPKHYGVEYRVLSNFWIFEEKLQKWVFNQSKNAFDQLLSGNDYYSKYGEKAREIIDTNNINAAKMIEVE